MDPTASGEPAAQAHWLWPDAASLIALTQPMSARTWPVIRRDPGALLLLLGHGSADFLPPKQALLGSSRPLALAALRSALLLLESAEGKWIDWRKPEAIAVYRSALTTAHFAQLVAVYTRKCDPNTAWVAGLLAPLGWFALVAERAHEVSACLHAEGFAGDPLEAQEARWDTNHAEVGRRLSRRWQLPDWLRIPIGHLSLPIPLAVGMGADAGIFAIVQLAAGLAELHEASLGLTIGVDRDEALKQLDLEADDLLALDERFRAVDMGPDLDDDRLDPRSLPYLPRVLRTAVEQAYQRGEITRSLERDVDRMHRLLVAQRAEEAKRTHSAKLEALAEFAAGASHEINNPLAVISGQSQYLLQGEPDEKRQSALLSIIRQVQRIHSILAELMQFARPGRPVKQPSPLVGMLRGALGEMQSIAEDREVRLEFAEPDRLPLIDGDVRQLQTALICLIRNAIEAAPEGGWVRLGCQCTDGLVEVFVDDSGRGPNVVQQQHMFDPFYSGRAAGRGRGLGLPTAWRLARENGGDVRYVPLRDGPTRFVLSIPLAPAAEMSDRLSA